MKHTLLLTAIVFSFGLAQEAWAQKPAPVQSLAKSQRTELSPMAFKEALETGRYQLLDVRTAAEFKSGHLQGALNIDWTAPDYQAAFSVIPADRPVLLYCHSGGRSEQALEYLLGKGLQVQHLEGGITAWRKAGLPVVQ